jgi:hypothetical protein
MTDIANLLLQLDDIQEEGLAHQAPSLDMPTERLERIARVAYRISQVEAERARKRLPPGIILKPWRGFSQHERAEAAATVLRVLQSLILLGDAEAPTDSDLPRH